MAFKGLRFAAAEIRHASAGTIMKVVMVAISVIPLLYGGLYLAAFLDPYENLDTVPVAVVNEDAGAEVNGEWRVVGDDVVEKLEDNHGGLGWHFVSADEAQAGIEDGTYYMTCTIPTDFTKTIASADSEEPKKAAFTIEYNQAKNMLASQIGETVWKEVRTQVSDTVAEEYWNTVFNRLNDGSEQIETAADGAGELREGLESAHDGGATITENLGALVDGSGSLASGLVQLAVGAATMKDGTGSLASGTDSLKGGVGDVSSGVGQIASGIGSKNDTSSSTLYGGVNQLITGLEQLKGSASGGTGLAYAASATHQLADGLNAASSLGDSIGELQNGLSNVSSALSTADSLLGSAVSDEAAAATQIGTAAAALQDIDASGLSPADQQKFAAALTSLGSASTSLGNASSGAIYETGAARQYAQGAAGGISTISTKVGSIDTSSLAQAGPAASKIAAGLDTAVEKIGSTDESGKTLLYGAASLKSGLGKLSSGTGKLAAGIGNSNDTSSSTLFGGVNQLADGASQLDSGASQLSSGASSAESGAEQVVNGAKQLRDGSSTLTDGLADAVDGSGELADGLADGASELHVANAETKAEVMSAPVELESDYYTTVKNYGTGFAPYFIALGLWVGALMAGFVLKPLNRRLVLSGGNPAMAAFSSFMPLALMSVVQALLMLVALQFGLQLQIDNVTGYYAFGVLVALAFAAFMQFLMAAFGFPGKFIAIILLMLQLTSAAGTFPIEQTPAFFQALNPFMPMTYVVAGMRQIMTGVDYATVASCTAVLVSIGIVSFGLTALVARFKRIITMEDLHPLLNLG